MADIDKIIKGLAEVRQNIDCFSGSKKVRLMDIVDEAIKLLKEQQVEIEVQKIMGLQMPEITTLTDEPIWKVNE